MHWTYGLAIAASVTDANRYHQLRNELYPTNHIIGNAPL
jgi:hypothetical protein